MDEARLWRLLGVGRSLIAELDPEVILDRLLEVAQQLTSARYAAIGVLDERREHLERFLTRGIDEETHRAIGDLPHGRGVLGVLIHDPQPLRLARRGGAGRVDPRPAAAAARGRGDAPGVVRVPARAPADAHVPRRADPRARR